jgi:Putative Flp pilus-assembly TadE/G-like
MPVWNDINIQFTEITFISDFSSNVTTRTWGGFMQSVSVIARTLSTTNRCLTCQNGSVFIIFALTLGVLVGITGMAIDFGRLTSSKSKLQQATDAALLAAVRTLGSTGSADKATATANTFFTQKLLARPSYQPPRLMTSRSTPLRNRSPPAAVPTLSRTFCKSLASRRFRFRHLAGPKPLSAKWKSPS